MQSLDYGSFIADLEAKLLHLDRERQAIEAAIEGAPQTPTIRATYQPTLDHEANLPHWTENSGRVVKNERKDDLPSFDVPDSDMQRSL
jgi:hypothetical protein